MTTTQNADSFELVCLTHSGVRQVISSPKDIAVKLSQLARYLGCSPSDILDRLSVGPVVTGQAEYRRRCKPPTVVRPLKGGGA